VTQALAGGDVRLGSLHPRRDLTYVTDTAAGLIAAAESPATIGRTLQLGTGHDVSIGEVVELIGAVLGRELSVTHDNSRVRPAASEVERPVSDPALAAELTGWRPQVDLQDGLAQTIDWMSSHTGRYRTDDYVI
jgi:nucleoside-diphosphate-sugar epimerase